MTTAYAFAGDRKYGRSIVTPLERRFKHWGVAKLPTWLETYHLTLMTLAWSGVNVALAFIARDHPAALWGVSFMIALQYVTDLFDGEVGRQRNTGLIRWGFHMDHLLDYVFLCSLAFVGYMISPAGLETWYFALLAILGGYMINSFLQFAATNEFSISCCGVGPTEFRGMLILLNTWIIVFGTAYFHVLLPAVVTGCFAGLVFNTVRIQRDLWRRDMAVRAEGQPRN